MIRRTIDAGNAMPRFYGLAWWNHATRQAVCYPIPLNYVLASVRFLWHRLVKKTVTLDEASAIACRAYQDGYADGKRSNEPKKRW